QKYNKPVGHPFLANVAKLLNYQLPATWEKTTEKKMRFTLLRETEEYNSIVTKFNEAMTGKYTEIVRIERIQNETWYMQYLTHHLEFKSRLGMDTEQRLYHGSTKEAADDIVKSWFNRSFAGVNGTVYGVGVYFSSNAAYSHGYARPNENGERNMFVARVLVGKTTPGSSSMKTPPTGSDSTTDVHSENEIVGLAGCTRTLCFEILLKILILNIWTSSSIETLSFRVGISPCDSSSFDTMFIHTWSESHVEQPYRLTRIIDDLHNYFWISHQLRWKGIPGRMVNNDEIRLVHSEEFLSGFLSVECGDNVDNVVYQCEHFHMLPMA
ncbi:unnamed protein product, partial [Rotaria magnacalcarata]